MNLIPDERRLFSELIVASQVLVTMAVKAGTVLSEEFQDMVTGPAANVQAVLDQCPAPQEAWDGQFRLEDCDIRYYTPDVPNAQRNAGVELTHRMTGLSTESYSKNSRDANLSVAARVLEQRVRAFKPPREDPLVS
jgi:hypothetical protein